MSEQLDRIEGRVNEFGYTILAAVSAGIVAMLVPRLSESVFTVAAFLLALVLVHICLSFAFASASKGYNRRFWSAMGISPRGGWGGGDE